MSDSYGRTPEGLWARTLQRIESLEFRLSAIGSGGADSGWIDLAATLAAGYTETGPGLRARKVGRTIWLDINLAIAAGTFTISTSGVASGGVVVCTDFPAQWRPGFPNATDAARLSRGPWSFDLTQAGELRVAFAPADSTWGAPTANPVATVAAFGSYPGA